MGAQRHRNALLRECGFTSVDVAQSPDDAIEAAVRHCPALITSDVQLKPGCGIATVLRVCDMQPVPVIFITGDVSEVMDRVSNAPVRMKPFSDEQLKRAVAVALTQN